MKRICKSFILILILVSMAVLPVLAAAQQAVEQQPIVQKTGIQSLWEPAKLSSAQLTGYLPKFGGLLLILVVGSLIALGAAGLVDGFLKLIQLEKGAKRMKIPEIFKKGNIGLSLSDLITELIFFLVIIATLITALEFYGVSSGSLTEQILSYIPHVITAVFILVLGILLALFISGIITLVGGNVRIAQSLLLGNTAKYAIIVVSVLMALRELGLGIIVTEKSRDIILAGLVLALALAFGLAGRGKAEKYFNKILKE